MNRLFSFLIAVFAGTLVFGQQYDAPKAVKNAFAAKYAATPTFAKKGDLYAADFVDKGNNYTAYFSEDGTWVKTEKKVTLESLKEVVQNEIKNRFMGENSRYKMDTALIIETPTGIHDAARFFMENGGTITIYFQADGTMFKREIVQ